MTSPEPATVYLSLGSNIDPEANLKAAIQLLGTRCHILAVSPVYYTQPQGYSDQPDFLNMAVKLSTWLSPNKMKQQVIAGIEGKLGRVRDPNNKNAPRTIDLDIALWNNDMLDYGDRPWHVPDPDICRFAHVALPLADLAPDYIHPETGQRLAEIAAALNSSAMQPAALDFERRYIVNVAGAIWREGYYLMIIRGDEDELPGILAFVGGGQEGEPGSDALEATLRREIREEVGLEIADPVYAHSAIFLADIGSVLNVIFLCRHAAGEITISDPGEVAEAFWLTADEILRHPQTQPWTADYLQIVERKRIALGW